MFQEFEQETLKELPAYSYEVCEFKEAKVYTNSHVTLKSTIILYLISILVKK